MSEKEIAALAEGNASGFPYKLNEKNYFLCFNWCGFDHPKGLQIIYLFISQSDWSEWYWYNFSFLFFFPFFKVFAEAIGTYFLIFIGCGSVAVNKIYESITFPGVCIAWGLIVMVMVYAVGHISGAHFNPAVTITFAIFRHFPYKQAGFKLLTSLHLR